MAIKKWALTAGLCLCIFAALATYKVLEIKAAIAFGASFPEQSESVEVYTASTEEYQPLLSVLGEVTAQKQVDISNELDGRIVSVNFIAGGQVTKDQILLQQDVRTEQANLDAAQARKDLAQTIYARAKDLRQTKAISQEQLDTAKAELAAQKAEVQALKSIIAKKTLRAPFDANAGLHDFQVGQFLAANTMITTLVGTTPTLWVNFKVPQFYPQLAIGSQVYIQRLEAAGKETDEHYAADIIATNAVLSKANRSFQYRAKVDKREYSLSPHASVEVLVPSAGKSLLVAIPATAVLHDNLGQYVYTLTAEQDPQGNPAYRAKRRPITVKAQQGEKVFISSGIKEKTLLAAAGAFKLHPGILTYARQRQTANSDQESHLQGGAQ